MRAVADIKVSVVMPARNAAATIVDSISSILLQDFKAFELLVIDDGSTDQTRALIEGFSVQDKRVRYLCSQKSGIVAALNTGLQAANSDYIARMDADDIMLAQRLLLQYRYLTDHPECSLVATQAVIFPKKNIAAGYREYMRWQNNCLTHEEICDDIYLESPFAHPTVMFRNNIVQSLGAYQEGSFPEDYELWLRMYTHGCRFHKLASVQLEWRDSVTRTSRVDPRYARVAFDQLRARYLHLDPRISNGRPIVVWGAGRRTRQRVAHIVSKGVRVVTWIDIDTNKIGNKIDQVWVRSPQALVMTPNEHSTACHEFKGRKPFVLCYVSNHGARDKIAEQLHGYGYRKGRDYLMVG